MYTKPMRRKDRQLSEEQTYALLESGEYGVLSTADAQNDPYGVPLSYALLDGKIVFHCAAGVGHKLENIAQNPRVCFTVVGKTKVLPEKFSTAYESVIVFGTAAPAEDPVAALRALVKKYSPDYQEKGEAYIAASVQEIGVYAITIEKMTGKAHP